MQPMPAFRCLIEKCRTVTPKSHIPGQADVYRRVSSEYKATATSQTKYCIAAAPYYYAMSFPYNIGIKTAKCEEEMSELMGDFLNVAILAFDLHFYLASGPLKILPPHFALSSLPYYSTSYYASGVQIPSVTMPPSSPRSGGSSHIRKCFRWFSSSRHVLPVASGTNNGIITFDAGGADLRITWPAALTNFCSARSM